MNITTALIALHTAGMHIDSTDAETWILRYGTQTQHATDKDVIALVTQMAATYAGAADQPPLGIAQTVALLRSDQVTVEPTMSPYWEVSIIANGQQRDDLYTFPQLSHFGTTIASLALAVRQQLNQFSAAQLADASGVTAPHVLAAHHDAVREAKETPLSSYPALSATIVSLCAALQPLGLVATAIVLPDTSLHLSHVQSAELTMAADGQQISFAIVLLDERAMSSSALEATFAALAQRVDRNACIPVLILPDGGIQALAIAAAPRFFPAQRWIINTVGGVEQHRWVSAPTGQMALDVLAVLRELRAGVSISVA